MNIRFFIASPAIFCVGIAVGYILGETRSHEYPTFAHLRSTRSFAHTFRIPTIDFENVPVADAIDYLRSLTRTPVEIEGGPTYRKMNFVLIDPDNVSRPLNLRLHEIPLDRLCDLIAEDSGLEVSFGRDAVVFSAPKPQAEQNEAGQPATRPMSK